MSLQAGIVKSDLVERRNERAVIKIRGKRFSPFSPSTSTSADLKSIRSSRNGNSNNIDSFTILKPLSKQIYIIQRSEVVSFVKRLIAQAFLILNCLS